MPATAIRPVAVKLDPLMRERMKRLADAKHRTPHWLMREADAWLEQLEAGNDVEPPECHV